MPEGVRGGTPQVPCLSYAPFRRGQTPFDPRFVASEAQIDQDMAALSRITRCVRTYSVGQGLDRVPEIAARHGMQTLMGIWLGRDPVANEAEIELAVATAGPQAANIRAIVVGNEVLLRRELTAETLGAIIRGVDERVGVPVTYADVWEFWIRNKPLADRVDFITIHILPYWEDEPVAASEAAQHVVDVRNEVAAIFPGRRLLIGETGWPSQGRMRSSALPSPHNQARVVQELIKLGRERAYEMNIIEAFDQPWKRVLEGTVGGAWGLLGADSRSLKFEWGGPVSNSPLWPFQAAVGIVFGIAILGIAIHSSRNSIWPLSRVDWLAIVGLAIVAGGTLGATVESGIVQARDLSSTLRVAALAGLAVALPVMASRLRGGTVSPRPLGHLGSLRTGRRAAWLFGVGQGAAGVAALALALALVFDPRYRDFPVAPFAAIAAAALVVPVRTGRHDHARAERWLGIMIMLCAVTIVLREGIENAQALLFAAALVILGQNLVRGAAVPKQAARG